MSEDAAVKFMHVMREQLLGRRPRRERQHHRLEWGELLVKYWSNSEGAPRKQPSTGLPSHTNHAKYRTRPHPDPALFASAASQTGLAATKMLVRVLVKRCLAPSHQEHAEQPARRDPVEEDPDDRPCR